MKSSEIAQCITRLFPQVPRIRVTGATPNRRKTVSLIANTHLSSQQCTKLWSRLEGRILEHQTFNHSRWSIRSGTLVPYTTTKVEIIITDSQTRSKNWLSGSLLIYVKEPLSPRQLLLLESCWVTRLTSNFWSIVNPALGWIRMLFVKRPGTRGRKKTSFEIGVHRRPYKDILIVIQTKKWKKKIEWNVFGKKCSNQLACAWRNESET